MHHSADPADDVHHSKPIPIATDHPRHRSASVSSDSSSSPTSSPALVTPPKSFTSSQFPITSSSPILYYLSQSPTKPPATFPFRGFPPPPVPEADEHPDDAKPAAHVRRASIVGRFQPPPTVPEPHHERGVNVLRRLSLSRPKPSDIFPPGNPSPPPNTAVPTSPIANSNIPPSRKPRRAATVTERSRPRRAPSPMGERILKGHFDGFN